MSTYLHILSLGGLLIVIISVIYPTVYMLYLRFTKLLPHIQFIPCFHWSDSSIRPTENNCEEGPPNHCGKIVENLTMPMFLLPNACVKPIQSDPGPPACPWCAAFTRLWQPPCHSDSTFVEKRFRSRFTDLFDLLGSSQHFFYIVMCDISKLLDKWRIQRKGLWALSALGG